ncbi:MarR family winged helix-turn-helix transcriptional regulator [Prosthecodimorpha staleyi]|uniref:MarR family winged helix-turn-helix transcriptional regulator n=1 Tax=Prosthecodimorpha staleyi TaxID=2840188 RepID=A0A947GC31_9HYPH|nr:MarR family winged helix-turn-helix transcriptional regulator [Prosthecodimorpha staleyi]MBT9289322.1 MarR family winged helix-turn-helix transcriptional regulator [Prosthecodimorpha staleyi]
MTAPAPTDHAPPDPKVRPPAVSPAAANLHTAASPAGAPAEGADAFPLHGHLFFYFSQIMAHRNRRLNAELKPFGVDYARWRIMAVLNDQPGCSMQQLADTTSVDRTSLTHTLKLMEAEGLVSRTPRATDRRSVVLGLTEAGSRLFVDILPTVRAQTDLALTGIGAGEADTLMRLLARMAENLRDES